MRLAVNGEYGMTVDELMRQIEETERLIVVHRNASYRSFLCQLALRPPGSLLTLGWRGLDFELLASRGDELGSRHPRWGSEEVSVILPPARRFRRFMRNPPACSGALSTRLRADSSELEAVDRVLPLTKMSGDHAKGDFADSMVEPIRGSVRMVPANGTAVGSKQVGKLENKAASD
jgi:hypothetical protein